MFSAVKLRHFACPQNLHLSPSQPIHWYSLDFFSSLSFGVLYVTPNSEHILSLIFLFVERRFLVFGKFCLCGTKLLNCPPGKVVRFDAGSSGAAAAYEWKLIGGWRVRDLMVNAWQVVVVEVVSFWSLHPVLSFQLYLTRGNFLVFCCCRDYIL